MPRLSPQDAARLRASAINQPAPQPQSQPSIPVHQPTMPGPNTGGGNTDFSPTRLKRQAIIQQMLLERYSYDEIATAMGITPEMVVGDVTAAKRDWESRRLLATAERVAEELAHLEYVRGEALKAWDGSKETITERTRKIQWPAGTVLSRDGQPDLPLGPNIIHRPERAVTRKVIKRDGNPQFLQTALESSREIRKMMGIDAPEVKRLQINGSVSHTHSYEELVQMDPAVLADLHKQALEQSASTQ